MAIDRQAILDRIYQELGHSATSLIPPGLWSQGTAPPLPPVNLEEARRLLAEAGVTGLELEIWPSPVARPYLPDARRAAEMIREDWLKIGVESEIVVTAGRDFIRKTMVGGHDVALFGWIAETLDRSAFLAPILGCGADANRSYWCDAQFDRLLEEASRAKDPTERETLYELARAILEEAVPVLPIAHSISFTPMKSEVVNYRTTPLGGHYFYGVDLE